MTDKDNRDVRVLRDAGRVAISEGFDETRAAFLMARDARLCMIPDRLVERAVEDLRAEGVFPQVEAAA